MKEFSVTWIVVQAFHTDEVYHQRAGYTSTRASRSSHHRNHETRSGTRSAMLTAPHTLHTPLPTHLGIHTSFPSPPQTTETPLPCSTAKHTLLKRQNHTRPQNDRCNAQCPSPQHAGNLPTDPNIRSFLPLHRAFLASRRSRLSCTSLTSTVSHVISRVATSSSNRTFLLFGS